MESGREQEGVEFLNRFEKVRPQHTRRSWRQPGMIESATLPAAERTRRQIERLRQDAAAHPDDPELRLRLAGLLLMDGRVDEASKEYRVLLASNAKTRTREEAGRFLLSFGQYELARDFLRGAAAENPAANLDLAVALFFSEGAVNALTALEQAPDREKSGDYSLLKASLLDSGGRASEAEQILEQGLSAPVTRPAIVQQAALLLLRQGRNETALALLSKPGVPDPDLLLLRAIVLGRIERVPAAEQALREIESQWPEWDRPYLAHGLLLERSKPLEAGRKLRTAIALGSQDPAARCGLARLSSAPAGPQCCAGGLDALLFATCGRP
jgi:thioredoxin-like negative regulator of GroEL